MKVSRIHEQGPPEVLRYEDSPDPSPGEGEALVKVEAIGVNFTDVNSRSGASPVPALPAVLGREAAGVVTAVGSGVSEFQVGDAVGWCGVTGSYAEQVAVPVSALVKLPQGIDTKTAAAALLQGMTAHYLAFGICSLESGDSVLVHAGAGGTGLLLIQMAKHAGATVYTTVSTGEKAALATEAGADVVINYTTEDFAERVMKGTGGKGAKAVFDAVGKTTIEGSLASVSRRGYLALYGQASGPVPPVSRASIRSSSYLTCPTLGDYTATREELEWRSSEVLGWVASHQLRLRIGGTFGLSEAHEAHRQLQGRESTGKLVLVP
ncbi:MAG: quinone oxidoreductase [Dehalococcoidia bacterium]|nr:quinone oxidoreductase [Dehalococcoidia bacterium]